MTSKEMKRLSRSELLEMLIAQMEENNELRLQLDLANAKLQSREIAFQRAGTLAEAALAVNGVLEAADRAAEQYLENIKRMADQREEEEL